MMDEPSPGADAAERAQSRCRCGGGEPSPGADVAGLMGREMYLHVVERINKLLPLSQPRRAI